MAQKVPPLIMERTDSTDCEPLLAWEDGATCIATMDELHCEIHKGNSYTGGHLFVDLANDASIFCAIKNNSGDKFMHVRESVGVSGACEVHTILFATGQTGGIATATYNRKTGVDDSGVQVWRNATALIDGTRVKSIMVPGGFGPRSVGETSTCLLERIIDPASWIAYEITNVSGSAIRGCVEYDFYLSSETEAGY